MKKHLDMLPTKDEVIQLRTYMRTNIDKFKDESEQFKQQFDGHLEIIRRYDEIISEKASKHSLYLQEVKMNDYFKPLIKEMDQRVVETVALMKEQRGYFAEFKQEM